MNTQQISELVNAARPNASLSERHALAAYAEIKALAVEANRAAEKAFAELPYALRSPAVLLGAEAERRIVGEMAGQPVTPTTPAQQPGGYYTSQFDVNDAEFQASARARLGI